MDLQVETATIGRSRIESMLDQARELHERDGDLLPVVLVSPISGGDTIIIGLAEMPDTPIARQFLFWTVGGQLREQGFVLDYAVAVVDSWVTNTVSGVRGEAITGTYLDLDGRQEIGIIEYTRSGSGDRPTFAYQQAKFSEPGERLENNLLEALFAANA